MFINKNGKIVSKAYGGWNVGAVGDFITPFCKGKAILKEYKEEDGVYYFMVDSAFNKIRVIDKPDYTQGDIGYTEGGMSAYKETNPTDSYNAHNVDGAFLLNGNIYLRLGGHDINLCYGLLSPEGDLVIAGLAGGFQEGLAPVIDESFGVGYVNEKGEWVIKFEVNEF